MRRKRQPFTIDDNVLVIATGETGKIWGMSSLGSMTSNEYEYKLKDQDKYYRANELLKLPKDPPVPPPIIESEKVIKLKSKEERKKDKLFQDRWSNVYSEVVDMLFSDEYGIYTTDAETFNSSVKICSLTGTISINIKPNTDSKKKFSINNK